MKIYISKNDEIYYDEIKNKGYRDDIYVYTNNKFYKIFIYEKTRFIQDFEVSVGSLGGFVPEPNTIFVEKITEIVRGWIYENKWNYKKNYRNRY